MITLYIGKSAAGKDAYYKRQVAMGLEPIISYTTRPMRDGEVQDVDYHFVSVEKFKELIKNDMLSEYRKYDTKVNNVPDTLRERMFFIPVQADFLSAEEQAAFREALLAAL